MQEASTAAALPAGARILRADNGAEMSIAELAMCADQIKVWGLDSRLRLTVDTLTDVTPTGHSEAFEVRFASGRIVTAAATTQFMALAGWKTLGDVKIGDRLAGPRRIGAPLGARRMPVDEIVLLAHMIGDGSCLKRQPIRYASIDECNLAAVAKAAKHFGVTAVRDDYSAARVTTLRLPAPYRLTHGRRNPIAAWMDGLGLFDKRSHEKFVPAFVFAMPDEQVALFLRHLWATDGCVKWDAKAKLGKVYYASSSRHLIDDVRNLLLRLGVLTRTYRIPQGLHRDAWHLYIQGATNQTRFLDIVDMHGAKFWDAREVVFNINGVTSNANVDTVPRDVWTAVREALTDKGMTHRAFAEAMRIKFCGSTMWKHSPSRRRLHRAAKILESRPLHDLATNHVFWDKVVDVSSVGEQEVYALTLAGADNVVAQGVSVAVTKRLGDENAPQADMTSRRTPSPLCTDFVCRDSR